MKHYALLSIACCLSLLLVAGTSLADIRNTSKLSNKNERLPSGAEYWAYRERYLKHAMIDVFVISPIACVAGAIPLTPGGLGTYEAAMFYLYNLVSPENEQGRGIFISFVFRIGTIIVAGIGMVFYWLHHREVMQVVHEVEEFQEAEEEERRLAEMHPEEAK